MNSAILENAQIDWREGVPFSTQFNDIYFSRTDGFEETRYTFIDGNQLLERWKKPLIGNQFRVAELGFGTGLNFLSTLYHWQSHGPTEGWLEYHSVEKFPLKLDDLIKAKSSWPQFNDFAEELIEHYPLPFKGIWQIVFPRLRAKLTLYWMDVEEAMEHWQQQAPLNIDAWFLDGFAPAKNPELWQETGFQCITQISAPDATLATFTAAGFVRRGLQHCGWTMSKRKGFGSKREMLVGYLGNSQPFKSGLKAPPWFAQQSNEQQMKRVAVIGAGIAGCSTARYLAESGFEVTLIEEAPQAANGASGNSAGIYYPFLSVDLNLTTQFFLHAYHRVLHDFTRFNLLPWVNSIGVINLTKDQDELDKLTAVYKNNGEFERWIKSFNEQEVSAGFSNLKNRVGLSFPKSGFVDPVKVCEELINHNSIFCIWNTLISQIKSIDKKWHLTGGDYCDVFDALVICNSTRAQELLPKHFLPSINVRGQTLKTTLKHTSLSRPKTVICDQIYLIPFDQENLYVGATFEREDDNENLSAESQNELLEKLEALTESPIEKNISLNGRVGFRLCSVDRLPFVGPLPKLEFYLNKYNDLWQGKPANHFPQAENWPNLYINIAHGARGITSSFLCASIITEYIAQQPFSLPQPLLQQIHPARCLIRELRKPPHKRLLAIKNWQQKVSEQ